MDQPPPQPNMFDRLLDKIAAYGIAFSGISLVLLIIIFGWLVFGRYVLNSTPTWAEQLGLLLIVGISFIAAAVGVHENRHLSVEFIRDAFPLRIRIWLHVAADALMTGFAGFMAVQGYKLAALNAGREIPLLGLSEAWRNVPIFICGVLILLFAGARLIRHVRVALGLRAPDAYLLLQPED